MKGTRFINRFSEKILIWANGPFWAQKWCMIMSLDLLWEFFSKFCTMEGVNRVMKMIIIFSKNIFVWGKWTILSPKMAHHHETGSAVRFFLKFCRMKGVHEHFISCFLSKNFIWGKLIFLGHFLQFDWAWLKLSQATVTIGSLVRPWFLSWLLLDP